MFEQFFLGLALLGCLAWGYRLLAAHRSAGCHGASCDCEKTTVASAERKGTGTALACSSDAGSTDVASSV